MWTAVLRTIAIPVCTFFAGVMFQGALMDHQKFLDGHLGLAGPVLGQAAISLLLFATALMLMLEGRKRG